ncbi:zinc ABC transporter substrate-binding protein ZnuA, partial [Pseudomonas aeruginosa]
VTPTEVLLPDGASPHDFALRPSDIQRLRSADLVLWVGPDMEAFLNKALVPISATRKLAISELSAVKPLLMKGEEDDDHDHAGEAHNHADDDHGHHHGEYNMHVWLSPEIAKVTAIAIHDRLLELMPQNKDKLDANLRQFENLLTQTDKNVGNMLTPVQGKGYFVFHDAYGYFEKHYGLSPLG